MVTLILLSVIILLVLFNTYLVKKIKKLDDNFEKELKETVETKLKEVKENVEKLVSEIKNKTK